MISNQILKKATTYQGQYDTEPMLGHFNIIVKFKPQNIATACCDTNFNSDSSSIPFHFV